MYWLANYESVKNFPTDSINVVYNIEEVKFEKFDYIFVCNSPIYSNVLSESLFNILIEIVKHCKECDKFNFYKPSLLNHISREMMVNDT